MYCEAGPVKIRLAARVVPDIDRDRWPESTGSYTPSRVLVVPTDPYTFKGLLPVNV
jgi:hypothetical protein